MVRKGEEPKSLFVKPIEGASVRDPDNLSILPKDGAVVTLEGRAGVYWRRRLYIDKTVVVATPPIKGATRTVPKPDKEGGK